MDALRGLKNTLTATIEYVYVIWSAATCRRFHKA
jgi:hypothetical protein